MHERIYENSLLRTHRFDHTGASRKRSLVHKLGKLSPFRRHVGHQTDPLKKVNSALRSAKEHVLASTHLRPLERDCTALVLQGAVDEKAVDEDPVIDLKGYRL